MGSSGERPHGSKGALRVCSFESRRAEEMRSLIERHGGVATVAPSMRELPLEDNPAAFDFMDALLAGNVLVVVFMTGVGARALLEALEVRYDRSQFFAALGKATTAVRGPKPAAVLREWNVRIDHRASEPNTWRELLAVMDEHLALSGLTVAVQEYGEPNDEFYRELEQRGARVMRVPVYRWALPEDLEPLRAAIRSTIVGEFDVLMFTSAQQVDHVLRVAQQDGLQSNWLAAASKCRIASIGPTCSERIREAGLPVHYEADPPRMGQLVRGALTGADSAS
jgi:uroporphyrinogen-III synthase